MGDNGYVDMDLARLSDWLYGTSIVVYVLAMVMFLLSLAAVWYARVETAEQAEKKELVPAAGVPGDRVPGRVAGPAPRRQLGDVLSGMGWAVAFVGFLAHLVSIVLRGVATDRAPWGNMYEFISLTMLACVLAGVVALRKPAYRPLLSFVLLPVVLLMFIGGRYLYTQPAPVVPALKSYWLIIHVSIISVASGVLLVSGVASVLYLVRQRWAAKGDEQSEGAAAVIDRLLPSSDALDRVAYKCVVVGFPLFGLGIILGAIWAEAAWGRFWGWDPKESVSFIAWVIYAAYLHARATAGWRKAAAWVNVAGFVALLFNLFAINLVVSGLHSYAGL
ncbi:c-type cytochrome biogenesis protein CcsB [Gordonia sp. PDNC005]|uniref:c-type cytochrome biogenesis protein CcsB n=1 Tax=unclassified Gordonia (in: high G+C Gram-positive bacteria) TaxID=2657482 RepID=UPI001964D0DA|nr:c-type cytochrome biogenesis protein CcsB [Gordonia sp. PDNC005]QRY61761.1 c-type cytochrome biogenesis protein CcsB [Gordonia sp. PDNC005]